MFGYDLLQQGTSRKSLEAQRFSLLEDKACLGLSSFYLLTFLKRLRLVTPDMDFGLGNSLFQLSSNGVSEIRFLKVELAKKWDLQELSYS